MYVYGGYDNEGPVYHDSLLCLDLEAPYPLAWQELAPMEHRRCYVASAVLDNQIVAVGGHDGQNRYCHTA